MRTIKKLADSSVRVRASQKRGYVNVMLTMTFGIDVLRKIGHNTEDHSLKVDFAHNGARLIIYSIPKAARTKHKKYNLYYESGRKPTYRITIPVANVKPFPLQIVKHAIIHGKIVLDLKEFIK